MIKQTATGWSFVRGDFTTEKFLNTIANIGYAGVEMIDTNYWSLAFDLGLVLATIGGHDSLTDGLNKRENHDRIEDEIRANIEVAVTNKIPNLMQKILHRNGVINMIRWRVFLCLAIL